MRLGDDLFCGRDQVINGPSLEKGGVIFHGMGNVTRRAKDKLLHEHYLRRMPTMSDTFEWWIKNDVVGVLTTGTPASRNMQTGALPDEPDLVAELNRLWLSDSMAKNAASYFISRCLKEMPTRLVISYADTAVGHFGYVYRAANFFYAGWTDMDRKTPRFDYFLDGYHSREVSRRGISRGEKIRRKPKMKYWTAVGPKKERARLIKMCQLPRLDWRNPSNIPSGCTPTAEG